MMGPPQGKGQEGEKGKGKALDEAQEEHGQAGGQQDGDKSSLTRLAESAISLPAALFGTGIGASELPRLGFSEKGASSRSGENLGRLGEASTPALVSAPASSAAMRSGQTQQHVAKEEAAFAAFLDSSVPVQSSVPELPAERVWQPGATLNESQSGRKTPSSSTAEQERRDGRDVVALLSTDSEPEPDYELGNVLSDSDISSLRRALFGEGSSNGTSPVAWDNVFNFIPRYLHEPAAAMSSITAVDLSIHLGKTDTDEAWQSWIEQWSRVLTGYQDEVWGDLGSLIREARAEVQRINQVEPGEKPPQPTALLRLQAILGHLRGAGS